MNLHYAPPLRPVRFRPPPPFSSLLAPEGSAFSCSELIAHARLDAAHELRAALLRCVGALNARKLGRLLAPVEGRPIAGLRVVRIASDAHGVIWSLQVEHEVVKAMI